MGKPAARVSDPTACPIPGHGTNPIVTGSPDVIIEGSAAARMSDKSACGSPIVSGVSGTVFINGLNAATVGSVGAHGNSVTAGAGTVIIGDTHVPAQFTPPTPVVGQSTWISFSLPRTESYAGLCCIAHFEDGTSLSAIFNAHNVVKFSNTSGKVCHSLDFGSKAEEVKGSVFDIIISASAE